MKAKKALNGSSKKTSQKYYSNEDTRKRHNEQSGAYHAKEAEERRKVMAAARETEWGDLADATEAGAKKRAWEIYGPQIIAHLQAARKRKGFKVTRRAFIQVFILGTNKRTRTVHDEGLLASLNGKRTKYADGTPSLGGAPGLGIFEDGEFVRNLYMDARRDMADDEDCFLLADSLGYADVCCWNEGYTQDFCDQPEIYKKHNFQAAWRDTHVGVPRGAPPYVLGARISFFGEDDSPPAGGTLHPNINARRSG